MKALLRLEEVEATKPGEDPMRSYVKIGRFHPAGLVSSIMAAVYSSASALCSIAAGIVATDIRLRAIWFSN